MGYVGRIGDYEDYEEPLAAPSAMWADLYALTMAQALYFQNRHMQQATFHAFVRKTPPYASYLISAGQNIVAEWMDKNWKFTDRDLRTLARKTVVDVRTGEKVPLFHPEFLEFLKNSKLELSLDTMPEGELAFATEPVYKCSGPVWQGLVVEGAILNTMNSQSNFATYGSILKTAANGKMVAEFGLRRSQAVGGLSSTRGSFIGGIDATSNCWAETNYGIPTIGTMAHAYVMIHETEMEAYRSWAKHNPHLGVFLPDTYDPEKGMRKVVEACKAEGIELQGFRQDSGDLGYLGDLGRNLADGAGYTHFNKNGVSNDLDAMIIHSLELEHPKAFNMYAVGTKLATMADYPALGGVYKVANVYENGITHEEIVAMKQAVSSGALLPGDIRDKVRDIMKLSSQTIKMTYPGELDLIRYLKDVDGKLMIDGGTICQAWSKDPLEVTDPADPLSGHLARDIMSVRRDNHTMAKTFNAGVRAYRPLQPVIKAGELVGDIETVHIARARALSRLDMLDASYKRILNPREMFVGVEEKLLERQEAMARRLRATGNTVEANLV